MIERGQTLDEQQLRGWIGRKQTASDVVTADLARKFAATFDREQSSEHGAGVAQLLHFCLAQPVVGTSFLGGDGHPPRGGFLPPVPLPRRMWAGGRLSFAGDLRIGDEIERISRIADISVKNGRSGQLCFVAVDHAIEVDGKQVISERQDIVYRDAVSTATKQALPALAPTGTLTRKADASETLLFRYSALTFNGHRIHYDRPYATGTEGYPGLVVQGPLQASWLLHFAADLHGKSPSHFSFRSLSPLYAGQALQLHASEMEGGLKLWTAVEGGPVAMSGEAKWA